MSRLRRVAPAVLLVTALAGCTGVVSGAGRVPAPAPSAPTPSSGSSSAPAAPGGSTSPPAPPTGCPHVVYSGAHLEFDCIASGMRAFHSGLVWPFSVRTTVEPATGWLLEEGAGHWGSADGMALVDIALNVRQQMLDAESYGVAPTVRTMISRPTHVDGRPAYLLQTTFGINPLWAKRQGTKVKQERLWMLAIEVAPNDVSLWYVSVPDLVSSLWAKVSAAIASIKVG